MTHVVVTGPAVHHHDGMRRVLVTAFQVTFASARRLVVVSFALEVVSALALAVQLYLLSVLLRRVLDTATPFDRLGLVVWPLLGVVATFLLSRVASAIVRELRWTISETVAADIERGVIARAAAAPLIEFDDPEFHNRIERCRNDAADQVWMVVSGFVGLTRGLLSSIAVAVVMASIAIELLFIGALALVPTALTLSLVSRRRYALYTDLTENQRERGYLVDLLTQRAGAKEARIYRTAWSLRPRYDALVTSRIAQLRADTRRRVVLIAAGDVMAVVILTVALLVALGFVADGRISTSDGGVAVAALFQLVGLLTAAGSGAASLRGSSFHVADYQAFIDGAPPAPELERGGTFETLEFRDVSFTYPGRDRSVFPPLSFTLRRGDLLLVRGPNGSGKSTLVAMLCGLLEPSEGMIVLDGEPVDDPTELARRCSLLFQDFIRFELELGHGIGIEDQQPDPARLASALERSRSETIVDAFPDGVHQRLGRTFASGQELSGGQWQRLALARALYHPTTPVLVLDEPTSMQDRDNTEVIHGLIRRLSGERTVVLVSHRDVGELQADLTIELGVDGTRARMIENDRGGTA